MKYLKKFENHSQYESYINGGGVALPNVSLCEENNEVYYNPIPDYSKEYLTFEVVKGGTITFGKLSASFDNKTIFYKVNNGEWTELAITTSTQQTLGGILNVGDKVFVKGYNNKYGGSNGNTRFNGTAKVNVYGNIMSLLEGDDFVDSDTLTETYTFYSLFYDYSNLLSAENLILPATTLTEKCYRDMFRNCTSLTTAPELPAETLAASAYTNMFYGCTNLTTAPELPATTLSESCYAGMFQGCTSLTTAPVLPATYLGLMACYYQMFYGCSNLNYIKAMFTDQPNTNPDAISATAKWLYGVAATGTFVKNSAAQWNATGPNAVPTGWTIETASA